MARHVVEQFQVVNVHWFKILVIGIKSDSRGKEAIAANSEIRRSKSERSPISGAGSRLYSGFEFRYSSFLRISDFDLRIQNSPFTSTASFNLARYSSRGIVSPPICFVTGVNI